MAMAALHHQALTMLRRPPSCIVGGGRRAPVAVPPLPPPPPSPAARRAAAAAVVARAKGGKGSSSKPQKPRQRKSKAERSRPSAEDVAAFLEEDLLLSGSDDDDDDEELAAATAYRRTRDGHAVPLLPLTAPPPSDFDKAALAAADSGDPSALLEAERGQAYRVFADEEQDRAWQEQQRRIAQRERRERIAAAAAEAAAAAAAAQAAAAEGGSPPADPSAAAAALAKAAGLPPPLDPDSPAAALLRVGESNAARPARLWNPRTGFSRSREEVEAEERAAAAALAAVQGQGPTTLERVSAERRRIWEREERKRRRRGEAAWDDGQASEGVERAGAGATDAAATTATTTPLSSSVPRSQVIASAAATGAAMTGLALLVRLFAASGAAAPLTGGDQAAVDALVSQWSPFPPPPTQQALGLAVATAAAVTSARLALCALLPASFGAQTARSNAQVLSPLQWPADDALVALVSGVPEELLFRGALIPATGHADAAGVAAAAALFGFLHLGGGGRGPAFALWATGVGGVYGALMLACGGNAWAPAAAHVLANFASATAWRMGAVKAEVVEEEEKSKA